MAVACGFQRMVRQQRRECSAFHVDVGVRVGRRSFYSWQNCVTVIVMFNVVIAVAANAAVDYPPTPVIVTDVPYWSYLIPLGIALVGAIQVLGLAMINRRINSHKVAIVDRISEAKESVVDLERQINSNLDRQIQQAVIAAIAKERENVAKALLRDITDAMTTQKEKT